MCGLPEKNLLTHSIHGIAIGFLLVLLVILVKPEHYAMLVTS